MFVIIYFAFVQLGFLLFGIQVSTQCLEIKQKVSSVFLIFRQFIQIRNFTAKIGGKFK